MIGMRFSFRNSEVLPIIPKGWPKPIYSFKEMRLSAEKIDLGRHLFYDPILSRDSSISCSSCHLQYNGFTHVDHALSHGIDGQIGTRNSPVLINLAWMPNLHWDGGVNHIEVQPLNPITHPKEMDASLSEVLQKLNKNTTYKKKFKEAFGADKIETEQLMKALSQFLLTLISSNSKYDQVKRGDVGVYFTEQEKNGYSLFQKYCSSCHKEPLFTTNTFASNGISPQTENADFGRYLITNNPADKYAFKIPTLRNSQFSFPYMHDGRFDKLKEVISYYSDSSSVFRQTNGGSISMPLHLKETQKKDLLAFILTLSDTTFLFSKSYGFPK